MCYFLFAIMSLSILYIVSVKFIQCSLCQLTTVNDVETSTGRSNRLPSYQAVSEDSNHHFLKLIAFQCDP